MKRWLLIDWGWLQIDLHRIEGTEPEGCFHTHIHKDCFRVVLWGGYVEELEDGTRVNCFPGRVSRIPPEYSHRIDTLHKDVSLSLWIHGPITHQREYPGDWASIRDTA